MENKCLFLDRDGVVNIDFNYVHSAENFEFVDGIFEICSLAKDAGFIVVIVTNQSGIGRGIYSEGQFESLTTWVHGEFEKRDLEITRTYYCPHHPTEAKGLYLQDCECRKPKPGMIYRAATELDIDLANSIFIGDKATDMMSAESAGIAKRLFIGRGDPGPATEMFLELSQILRSQNVFL
jgi:D-glycero-D-manno-heptose 1,7-bisphosphate phosphatase